MSLPPEKILLRWMNFQLKKAGYTKTVTNFSSDIKVSGLRLKIDKSFFLTLRLHSSVFIFLYSNSE